MPRPVAARRVEFRRRARPQLEAASHRPGGIVHEVDRNRGGVAHVAYIPNGRVTGLSKLARVVDEVARRPQVQERLTTQIAETIMDVTEAEGVGVIIEARHMCMMMRGVQKQNSVTTTSAFTGAFEQGDTRAEFLRLVGADLH